QLDQMTDQLKTKYKIYLTDKQNDYTKLIHNLKQQHPETKLINAKEKLNRLTENNKNNIERIITFHTNKFKLALDKVSLLNTHRTMIISYSLDYRNTNEIVIKSVKDVKIKDEIEVQVNDGRLSCEVIDKRSETLGE